jgi:phage portal protein BeeE
MTIPSEGIVHLRGLTLDGFTGLSPIAYHRETIGLAIAAEKYGAAFFGNSARPDGVLTVPTVLSEASREGAARVLGGKIQGRRKTPRSSRSSTAG